VLPGLDTGLDDEAWQSIGGVRGAQGKFPQPPASNHPQFAMQALLHRLGIRRGDVEILSAPAAHGRDVLVSEAMRPSNATAEWHRRLAEPDIADKISLGMKNLAVIEAANPEMEALATAVAMREARHLDKTAALVTPDRALARRVMAALGRWNLAFDDSGGDALMDTSAGIFARLAAEAVAKQLEPPTLLALLKHPLCRLGGAPGGFRDAVEPLELALLRGTRPQAGSAGLARDFDRFRIELSRLQRRETSSLHTSEPRTRLRDRELDRAQSLIASLQTALSPLESLASAKPHDFAELAKRHREVLIELSRNRHGVALVFEGHHGLALASAFDDLLGRQVQSGLTVQVSDYPEVFQTAFGDRMVRRPEAANAPLRIYGPLEARLTETDRVIIGGLVEGVWPPSPRVDPWLSRPMRHELGLDLPERRIGLSAHDFAQLLGTDDVILSHPLRPSLCGLRRLRFAGRDAGQCDAKPRAPTQSRFESQSAAELLGHQIEDDVKPKPGTALATARGEEGVERATLDLLSHADSVVGHEDIHVVAHLPRLDDDGPGAPVGKGMNDAVEEQIRQYLSIGPRIAIHADAGRHIDGQRDL